MLMCMVEYQKLGDKFHINHASPIVLDIKKLSWIGVALFDFVPNAQNVLLEFVRLALCKQYFTPQPFKLISYPFCTGNKACPGNGLVLPGPRFGFLIINKGINANGNQTSIAIGAQTHVDLVQASG